MEGSQNILENLNEAGTKKSIEYLLSVFIPSGLCIGTFYRLKKAFSINLFLFMMVMWGKIIYSLSEIYFSLCCLQRKGHNFRLKCCFTWMVFYQSSFIMIDSLQENVPVKKSHFIYFFIRNWKIYFYVLIVHCPLVDSSFEV